MSYVIGDGACVAAMSVVTRNVPPYAVVAGNPAQVKRYRFPDPLMAEFLRLRWWRYAPWDLEGAVVDQPGQFLGHMERLHERGMPAYTPKEVILAELLGTA